METRPFSNPSTFPRCFRFPWSVRRGQVRELTGTYGHPMSRSPGWGSMPRSAVRFLNTMLLPHRWARK